MSNVDILVRAHVQALTTGEPFESLADWARRECERLAAAKVVSIADARLRLRPS